MRVFDKKFGSKFVGSLPGSPGVYFIYDVSSILIYVGKAKNLRRRISQYRNSKRCRKHRKMTEIIREAADIRFEVCESEIQAELLEISKIQQYHPKWNVAGAFHFLYPMIGVSILGQTAYFCYTTQSEAFAKASFEFHGAFRSRHFTREAFFALIELLKYLGHPLSKNKLSKNPWSRIQIPKYSYIYAFRQLPMDWVQSLELYWKGISKSPLEELILHLVENAGARNRSSEVQEQISKLVRFWKVEARPLRTAIEKCRYLSYPVKQLDRDALFLQVRNLKRLQNSTPAYELSSHSND
jgi:excinuclease ABC subunit C